MMRNFFSLLTVVGLGAITSPASAAESPMIGVVNFASCVTESKAGKKEQESMEAMRKQIATHVEDSEKELREIAAKFEDPEYLDSLSPKAEEDLKIRYQALQEDMGRLQNQYYQILQNANYQMMNKINQSIAKAATDIAEKKKLDYVINKDLCFYIRPDFDVTTSVIEKMNENFELDAKAKKLSENDLQLNSADEAAR